MRPFIFCTCHFKTQTQRRTPCWVILASTGDFTKLNFSEFHNLKKQCISFFFFFPASGLRVIFIFLWTCSFSQSLNYIYDWRVLFCFVLFLRAAPGAYGSSQAKGLTQRCSCWPKPQPKQHQIWGMPATYTTAYGNATSLTLWVSPRIKPESSWILIRFLNLWATVGNPQNFFLSFYYRFKDDTTLL